MAMIRRRARMLAVAALMACEAAWPAAAGAAEPSAKPAIVAWKAIPEGDLPRYFQATDIKALYAALERSAPAGQGLDDLFVFAADSVAYDGARSLYRVDLPQNCNKYVRHDTDMIFRMADDQVAVTVPAGGGHPEERRLTRWYLAITNGCRLELPTADPSYVGYFSYDVVFSGNACPCGGSEMLALYVVRLRPPFRDRRPYDREPDGDAPYRLRVDQHFVFGDMIGLLVIERGSGKVLLRLRTG